MRYKDLIARATGDADWFARSKADKIAKAEAMGLGINPAWEVRITNEIFSKKIEPTLIQPTFVTHLPKELCPLAKITADDPTTIDVFELTIGGMEVAPAYSEQNDPDVQRQMFEAQAGEEKQNIDHDFLLAPEHGMPPPAAWAWASTASASCSPAPSIRDVILFPQLRPGGGEKRKSEKSESRERRAFVWLRVLAFSAFPLSSLPLSPVPWYLYLALKQLFPTGRRFPFFTLISMLGVTLGVAVLVIVTSVMGGFGHELRKMIVQTEGEVQVEARAPIANVADVLAKVRAVPKRRRGHALRGQPGDGAGGGHPAFPIFRGIELESVEAGREPAGASCAWAFG